METNISWITSLNEKRKIKKKIKTTKVLEIVLFLVASE